METVLKDDRNISQRIEAARDRLYKLSKRYGYRHARVISASQDLDQLIFRYMEQYKKREGNLYDSSELV